MDRKLLPKGELSEEWRAAMSLRVVVWCVAVALVGVALLALAPGRWPVVLPAQEAGVPVAGTSAELDLLVRDEVPMPQDDPDRRTVESAIAAYGN